MKIKKLYVLLSVIMVITVLASCSQKTQTADNTPSETADGTKDTDGESGDGDKYQSIALGETVSVPDAFDFAVTKVEYTDDVTPEHPDDGYLAHYEAGEGKMYLDIAIMYKNTSAEDVSAYNLIRSQLLYDNKYNYNGDCLIESSDRTSLSSGFMESISPLMTAYLHCKIEVPNEVADGTASFIIGLVVKDHDDKVYCMGKAEGTKMTQNIKNAAETSDGTGNTENTENIIKTATEIKTGENITSNKCEFMIEHCVITDDVVPPNPDYFYSHYEADEGMTYVDICISYKNTDAKSVDADSLVSGKLKYADKYEYSASVIIEEEGRSDLRSTLLESISPLTSRYLHCLFKVPDEVGTSNESIVVNLRIDGNDYKVVVR